MTPTENRPTGWDLLACLATTPEIYIQKLDLVRNTALLVRFSEAQFDAASFLDDRMLGNNIPSQWVSLQSVIERANRVTNSRPLHFIFHSGHVGSTLVSRLLEVAGGVLALREPFLLRQLADAHDVVGLPESYLAHETLDQLFRVVLKFWSQGFSETTAVIVKATSSAARIAPSILEKLPLSRGICVNVRAEIYVTTLLANPNLLTELKLLAPERIRRLQSFGMPPPPPLYTMSFGELAAMGWLVGVWSQQKVVAAAGGRVITVDFDALLANVRHEMGRVLQHFGLPCDEAILTRVAVSPVLTRYSKAQEHAYSAEFRANVLAESRARHHAEIRKGLQWIARATGLHAEAARVVGEAGG